MNIPQGPRTECRGYEDKYLREKVNRISARQKEGMVVIAAYKDGSGLLTGDDLRSRTDPCSLPIRLCGRKSWLSQVRFGTRCIPLFCKFRREPAAGVGQLPLYSPGRSHPGCARRENHYPMRQSQRHLNRRATQEGIVRSSKETQRRTGAGQCRNRRMENHSEGKW